MEVYSAPADYQAQCACVECVGLTCPISSGFYVINVQLWQTTRQPNWLSSVCKLMYCPDTVLPQCGCKLRIVWIKPAQKGLKLCYTCKASHAQDPAQSRYCWTVPQDVLLQDLALAHLAYTRRTAMMKSTISLLRTKPHHWGCNV